MSFEHLLASTFQLELSDRIKEDFSGQVVLITGAAGSIGSELSKLLAVQSDCQLVLLDHNEFGLYNLQQELASLGVAKVEFVLADICDKKRIAQVFKYHTPTIVYHAAAYKHVPLMESYAYEAIKVNLKGTKIVANASKKYHAEQFILISTDKAVNPSSMMGATKRLAELYVSYLNGNCKTNFKIVRFGNIPHSNGSVLPLFENQIMQGGPITITHKQVTRYFISMKRVCESLLQIPSISEGNLIVCEMGNPIYILDLVKKMVDNLTINNDVIHFDFIGLRPGEKLHEELYYEDETTLLNKEKNLNCFKLSSVDKNKIKRINKISKVAPKTALEEINAMIYNVIPTYC